MSCDSRNPNIVYADMHGGVYRLSRAASARWDRRTTGVDPPARGMVWGRLPQSATGKAEYGWMQGVAAGGVTELGSQTPP